MSLLDTFSLIFETDADEAADDVERLSDTLDETGEAGGRAADGVDDSSEAATKGAESFSGMAKSVGGLIAAYLSWQAISASVIDQALATDQFGKFAQTVDESIETMDAWGAAVELNGGSADSFRGSVESLNDAMADIALGGGGDIAEVLGRIGVSALGAGGRIKSVTELLPQIADAFQNLSSRESVAFGQKLGLDQGTILLLQQGRDAVEGLVEQQRQLGGRTQEGFEASAAFNDEMKNTSRVFTGIADAANQRILPVLTDVLGGFRAIIQWAQEHKTVVTAFFAGVAGIITAVYLPAITSAAVATIAAAAPFIAIGAAIAAAGAAFALLFEDVKAYIGGQESFIGSLAEKYEWFGKLLDGVINGVKFLFRELSEFGSEMATNLSVAVEVLGSILGSVFDAIGIDMEGFGDVAGSVTDGVIASFEVMGKVISTILDFIASPIETTKELIGELMGLVPDLQEVMGMAGDAWDSVTSWFAGDEDEPPEEVARMQTQADAALAASNAANANPMLTAAGGGGRVNYINQTNSYQANVDARGMSREDAAATFSEQRQREIAMAKGQLDDGVAY